MEKRKATRVKRRLNASIECDGKSFRAIAMHFSENGLFLQGRVVFKVGTPIVILLQMRPDFHLSLNAVVRSIRNEVQLPGMPAQSGVGIELITPPVEYLEYVSGTRT